MSFVDALNQRGEVQTVPEHYLADFPEQFKPVHGSNPAPARPTPAKPAPTKES